jgi:hypothetical protein
VLEGEGYTVSTLRDHATALIGIDATCEPTYLIRRQEFTSPCKTNMRFKRHNGCEQ